MGIPSDTTERIQVKAENGNDKDSTQSGGNVDSGYHSFTCAPTPYSQTVPEMITTSLGHDDDFPPPQISSAYNFGYPSRTLLDQARTNHPGVGEFFARTTISNTLAPSSDPETLQTAKSGHEIEEASELAEKIQFCLKLGYSKQQIRSALLRIGPNASKNDILMAIGDFGSDSGDVGTVSKTYTEGETADNKAGNDVDLVPRGPSSTTEEDPDVADNLRPIVIDGSNVAMSHGNKEYFSCKGIQIAVQYFLDRGHRDITVFVPIYRKEQTRPDAPIKNQEILNKLEAEKILVWTPSRHVNGRRVTCYDDRFIVKLAELTKGVIVSNDNFRDLKTEKPEWKEIIEKHLLMYSFVNDRFMPPDDPLGRNGPSLDNLLRIRSLSEEKKKPECPYGKKCTYGKKCKYFHPEVPLSSVSEILNAKRHAKPGAGDAQQLAVEVVAECNERNGANIKNPKPDGSKKQDDLFPTSTQRSGPRTVSPSTIGASGGSNNPSPIVNGIHPPVSSMSAITDEMNGLGMGPRNGYPPFMQYPPPHHGENNSHSAGANGKSSNGLTPRMGPNIPTPPALHSQFLEGPGRNRVASAANPQRVHSHIVPQLNHSSPSPMQSYERSLLDPQHTRVPQFPMTYPTHPSHHQPSFPSLSPYYMNEMIYHQQQQHQQMMYQQYLSAMNAIPSPGNPRHALPGYSPYPHYPQHGMMPPTTNLTTPHHPAVRQAVYAHGHHSSPPQFQHGSQSRNGPIDQTPQLGFRDPSNPRHNLFKNLCGLFSPRIVERVMLANPRESDPKRLAKLCLDMD